MRASRLAPPIIWDNGTEEVTESFAGGNRAMNASDAVRAVVSALGTRPDGVTTLDSAAAVLARLADPGQLLEIIRSIRDDPALVRQCAAASGRHPLGHDKIVLITHSAFHLRVHVWWPDRAPGVEHVHHHRFGVATTVVRGYYDMQVFHRAAAGISMTEYRQHSNAEAQEWYLESAGTARLRLLATARIAAGAGYILPADALHRVLVPRGSLCLTLFLAVMNAAGTPEQTRVFAMPETAAPSLVRAARLSPGAYLRLLDAIAMELAGAGAI